MERTAAVYVRISQDREGSGLGTKRQEADARALAERLGWSVAAVYRDDDTSAYSGKPRPAYRAMLEAVASGAVNAIIAWHNDRLHRSPLELEEFIGLLDRHGVLVHTVQAGEMDLSTPSGRMVARQLGSVARYESEHKADRIRSKARELAKAGKLGGGGTRPFGYNKGRLTINEDEALLVKEAAVRLLAGEGVRTIMNDWTRRDVSTVKGRPWQASIFRKMMMSGRIAGWREHRGELVAEAVWPGIIGVEDLNRIRALLTNPARKTTAGGHVRKYTMTGLAACGLCGKKLIARAASGRVPSMVCASGPPSYGCGKIRIAAEPLTDYVLGLLLGAAASGDLERRLSALQAEAGGSTLTDVQKRLEAARGRLQELSDDYYRDHLITKEQFKQQNDRLRAEVKSLESQEQALLGTAEVDLPKSAEALRDAWDTRGIEWRLRVLRLFFSRIEVLPVSVRGRNTFDPTRVHEVWLDERTEATSV